MLRKILAARRRPKGFKRVSFLTLFKASVFHRDPNLIDMLFRTPNRGVNYKVWRHTWPENMHYLIVKTDFHVFFIYKMLKNHKNGTIYGIKYENGILSNK